MAAGGNQKAVGITHDEIGAKLGKFLGPAEETGFVHPVVEEELAVAGVREG